MLDIVIKHYTYYQSHKLPVCSMGYVAFDMYVNIEEAYQASSIRVRHKDFFLYVRISYFRFRIKII